METLQAIKNKCGKEYPVWIKLNSCDFDPEDNGVTENAFLTTAKILAKSGIDAIEVSGGTIYGKFAASRPKKYSAYHRESAEKLTQEVDASVVLVGGIRNIELAEEILANTEIEAISLCRPFIREPQLMKRWAEGDRNDAKCVAYNGFLIHAEPVAFLSLKEKRRKNKKRF